LKGGYIKQEKTGEMWSYNGGNGILRCVEGPESDSETYFIWDGVQINTHGISPKKRFGRGRWNGVFLDWYEFKLKNKEEVPKPTFRYIWIEQDREFLSNQADSSDWKFSRHFLTKKGGGNEWLCEGVIPEPIAIFVQIISRTQELKREKKKLKERAKKRIKI